MKHNWKSVARWTAICGLTYGVGACVAAPDESESRADDPASVSADTTDGTSEEPAIGAAQEALSTAVLQARSDVIKARAAMLGITNPLVIAGIAYHETRMAQCANEFSGSCGNVGASSDCPAAVGGILAGSGDGICASKQGGLGMFQLDAGTYSDTLNKYPNVGTISGNADAAINFIIDRFGFHCSVTPVFANKAAAIAWINSAKPGTAAYDTFMKADVSCYNGCQPGTTCPGGIAYTQLVANYKSDTEYLRSKFSAITDDYWYSPVASNHTYTLSGVTRTVTINYKDESAPSQKLLSYRYNNALGVVTYGSANLSLKTGAAKSGTYGWSSSIYGTQFKFYVEFKDAPGNYVRYPSSGWIQ